MLITDQCETYLDAVKSFATRVGKIDNLEDKLAYLDTYAEHDERGKTRCVLFKDFAPYSFGFTMLRRQPDGGYTYWFNGGVIFHGAHDGGGSGAAPTYSVCLSPTDGWEIHT